MQANKGNVTREIENAVAEAAFGDHRQFAHRRRRRDLTRLIRYDNVDLEAECLFHLRACQACLLYTSRCV